MSITVPADIYEDLIAVRDSGITNMLDLPRVVEILQALGNDRAAAWIVANKKDYAKGVLTGFAPDG